MKRIVELSYGLTGFAVVLILAAAIAFLTGGCANTGTYAVVGDVSAPVDLSDASDTYTIRAFFSMQGAKAWSRKNSRTKVTYTNNYTNAYLFGMVDTKGVQQFEVEVEPTVDEAETVDVSGTSDSSEPENQPK